MGRPAKPSGCLVVLGFFLILGLFAWARDAWVRAGPQNQTFIGGAVVVAIVLAVALRLFANARKERARLAAVEKRRAGLLAKYGDQDVVNKIIAGTVWRGETTDMLRDSLGEPVDRDVKVMKTKAAETWKWGRQGRTERYAVRVMIENGVVVGWEIQ